MDDIGYSISGAENVQRCCLQPGEHMSLRPRCGAESRVTEAIHSTHGPAKPVLGQFLRRQSQIKIASGQSIVSCVDVRSRGWKNE